MRVHINNDGSINAVGFLDSYPHELPTFIEESGHLRWRCLNVSNIHLPESWEQIVVIIDPLEKKKRDIAAGREILLLFLAQVESVSLNSSDYVTVSELFKYVEIALNRGDLVQAKAQAEAIPAIANSPIWNQAIKDQFVNLIQSKA